MDRRNPIGDPTGEYALEDYDAEQEAMAKRAIASASARATARAARIDRERTADGRPPSWAKPEREAWVEAEKLRRMEPEKLRRSGEHEKSGDKLDNLDNLDNLNNLDKTVPKPTQGPRPSAEASR